MLATESDGSPEGLIDVSPYLKRQPRLLRDACQAARRDDSGSRCPTCSVRSFCEDQAARAGRPRGPAPSR